MHVRTGIDVHWKGLLHGSVCNLSARQGCTGVERLMFSSGIGLAS